jgi:4-amino-4-deoxy-L-arabinose transferase-like glycosyltransferase
VDATDAPAAAFDAPAAASRGSIGRRERWVLLGALALGVAIRVTYVLATRHLALAGDSIEYDAEGKLIAAGHWFYTAVPYGVLHAGAWKAPGYPAWVGIWYSLIGHHPVAVRLLQVPFGALTIVLTWVLARRLFGPRVAMGAALLVAVYPLAWQYEELLYSESMSTPLLLGVLIVIFTGTVTKRRAALCGLLVGLSLLVRPSAEFLLLGALVAWIAARGVRQGVLLTAVAAVVAALVVAPWTIRNAVVLHGFVPVSLQDAALYGTFNSQAAHDPVWPYAWRPDPPGYADVLHPARPLSDIQLRSRLISRALSYISAHPAAVPAAFFWNGLSRLWDIRRRSRSLTEVPFEGRSRLVSQIGLDIYDVLLPLALFGLWRARRRRGLVVGLLAIALGAAVVYTADSGTRYRAPLEPVIVVLACAGVLGARVSMEVA